MADTLNTLTETPSFNELRSALGIESTPVDATGAKLETTAAEATTEAAKTEETPKVEDAPKTEETAKVEDPPKPDESAKEDRKPKRFSELTKRAQEAEAETARLRAENESLKAAKPSPGEAPKAAEIKPLEGRPVKPNAETFTGTWAELEAAREKYTEDLAAWSVKDVLHKQEIAKQQATRAEQLQTVQKTWQEQVDASVELNERTEEAIKVVGKVALKLGITEVIKESEVGVEIVLALDKDPTALDKLSKMSIASAAREIGRIEAGILANKTVKPAVAAKKLPEPPAAVGGAANGEAKGIDPNKLGDLTLGDLRKYTKQHLNPRGGNLIVRRGTVS